MLCYSNPSCGETGRFKGKLVAGMVTGMKMDREFAFNVVIIMAYMEMRMFMPGIMVKMNGLASDAEVRQMTIQVPAERRRIICPAN